MQKLLGDKLGTSVDANSFLRELFLQRFPPNVRMVLASAETSMDLNSLADMADIVMEVVTPVISSVTTTTPEVSQEVACLTELVGSLTTSTQSCSRSRSRFRRLRSPARQQHHTLSDEQLCWYHDKFGEEAQKCRAPCSQAGH